MMYTDKGLVDYYNMVKGTSKTELTLSDVISIGTFMKCVAIVPPNGETQPIYVTDGFMSCSIGGVTYVPCNDFIVDSWNNITEENDINNDSTSIGISLVNKDWIGLITGGYLTNSMIQMHLEVISPASSEVLDTQLFFTGYIDNFEIDVDGIDNISDGVVSNKVTVNLNSIYRKLDLQSRNLCTDSIHRYYEPNDMFFSLIGTVNSQTWSY